jgi:alpha-glucosidase (family GH31 glycosyl hydrolase)
MYDLGANFKNEHPENLKAFSKSVFKGAKYRITILTERLVRLEYDEEGKFYDMETPIVKNRVFPYPQFVIKEDEVYFTVETKYMSLTYQKDAPFTGKTLTAKVLGTENTWYYGDNEVQNFKSCAKSLDGQKSMPPLFKGLFSPMGYATIDDSKSIFIDPGSNILVNNLTNHIDLYLFVYNKDFGLCLRDYYVLSGLPELLPRYALGNWWSKDTDYNQNDVIALIDKFKRSYIPMSVFLLDNNWSKKDYEHYPNIQNTFTFDPEYFSQPEELIQMVHDRDIKLGLKINPGYGFYPMDQYYETAKQYIATDENGVIKFNPWDARTMDLYLKLFIHPLKAKGIDLFWNDYNVERNEDLYILNDYMAKDMRGDGKRPIMLSRNSGMAAHRYNVLYSGRNCIDWNTLKILPIYNSTSANLGVTWWSHDVGGSIGGIEDSDLYLRSIQLGVFSPILRFNTQKGKYFKREPWRWDVVTNNIATYYLQLRHRLIPYIYSEAYQYSKTGSTLIKPFYYTNLDLYDDPNYVNQYYFGKAFMISPIITPLDEILNRTIQKYYMPDGVWYDFKTGKRYLGNHKYVSFYKIEDYPIFVSGGSVIPLAGEKSYMSYKNPVDFDVHIFPGRSNNYRLYEDDGDGFAYKSGRYCITEFDYNYRHSNYTLIIRPIEGEPGLLPEKRDYRIIFRNTKQADNVVVYENEKEIEYSTLVTDSDFVVEIKDVSTRSQITINCYGQDIEIDALMLIKDDIEDILSDLKIETKLKDDLAKIVFNEELSTSEKRISVRKLKKKGLDRRSVKIFLRLLEYMEM